MEVDFGLEVCAVGEVTSHKCTSTFQWGPAFLQTQSSERFCISMIRTGKTARNLTAEFLTKMIHQPSSTVPI